MKLSEFCEDIWLPRCEKRLRECTVVGYKSVYKNHIKPDIGGMELSDITPRAIDAWIESKPTPGAARQAYNMLKIAVRLAYKMELVDSDPTLRVLNVPPKHKSQQPTLTKREVGTLIDGFRGHPLEAWVICAATLGLRREEACALLWGDIDLSTGAVSITKGAQDVDGRLVVNPPKTGNGYRTVWLAGRHLERMRELGAGKRPDEGVTPYRPNSTAQRYRRHCEEAGLPYVPPKNLRTTFGTLAVEEWDVGRVAKWMGHYDPSVTMGNYVHPRDESVQELSGL